MRFNAEPRHQRLARGFRGHAANLQPRHRREALQLATTQLSRLQHQPRLSSDQRTSKRALEAALGKRSSLIEHYLFE